MKIGFAAGDIGGARALAAVIHLAAAQKIDVAVFRHGSIVQEYPYKTVPWQWISPDTLPETLGLDAFVFTSSVYDSEPLGWARSFQESGIPVLHLLDHWGNYSNRLRAIGHPMLRPDIYAVMDCVASKEAISAGFEKSTIKITGSPALAGIQKRRTVDPKGPLVFISEPISKDQGSDPNNASFRGYTEYQVLDLLLTARSKHAPDIPLWIFPHPRETLDAIHEVLVKHRLPKFGPMGGIVPQKNRQSILESARGVIGMSSILLYKRWLAGYPIFSIQPNLKQNMRHYLLNKPGVNCCLQSTEVSNKFIEWLIAACPHAEHLALADKERNAHKSAASNVLEAIKKIELQN